MGAGTHCKVFLQRMVAGVHCRVLLQRWGARAHCVRAAPEQTCCPRHHAKMTKPLPPSKDERQKPGSLLGATGVSTQLLCSPGRLWTRQTKSQKCSRMEQKAVLCPVQCCRTSLDPIFLSVGSAGPTRD